MKKEIKFGVIGAGYMGKAYAIALNGVSTVFSLSARAVPEMIATASAALQRSKPKRSAFVARPAIGGGW